MHANQKSREGVINRLVFGTGERVGCPCFAERPHLVRAGITRFRWRFLCWHAEIYTAVGGAAAYTIANHFTLFLP